MNDMKNTVYTGTYTGTGSKGIYRFSFEDGVLGEPEVFAEIKNPKYIDEEDGVITAVCDFPYGSGAALVNENGRVVSTINYEERTSCYVTRRGDKVYSANYHTGTFSVLEEVNGQLRLDRTVHIRDGAGCHQVLFWKDRILVPCLFLNRVMIFNENLERIGSIKFTEGTGPRHGVFTADGEYLYLVSELSNELFVIHTGDWEVVRAISVLPDGEKNRRGGAAVRMSEDEKHVYVSTRGLDILSVVEMKDHVPELVQTVSCGGKHPRDFILNGNYLLCANRFSNDIVSFALNEDGTVGQEVSRVSVPEPVSMITE